MISSRNNSALYAALAAYEFSPGVSTPGKLWEKPRVASATPEINRRSRDAENLTRLPWVETHG